MGANLLMTTTSVQAPLDSSNGTKEKAGVSEFLTLQALTNFGAMTGSITAAWYALQRMSAPVFSGLWVPYVLAAAWGVVSILISLEGLKKDANARPSLGTVAGAAFVALINALVLASAVVGVAVATKPPA